MASGANPKVVWEPWHTVAMAALVLCVALFYLGTIRSGHDWGDDFALYIHHAKNMVEGQAYSDTGLIHNPARPLVGQTPPGFPCLLAPVYYFFGLNLTAMKVEMILFFVGALVLMAVVFRNELPPVYLLLMIGLIGFNPVFWLHKDHVLSDLPFLFIVYAIMLLHQRAESTEARWVRQIVLGVIVGMSVYVAAATRMVGIMFVPSMWVYDFLRNRRPSRLTVVTTIVFVISYGVQRSMMPIEGRYFEESHLTLITFLKNVGFYFGELSSLCMCSNESSKPALILTAIGATILVGVGYKICWTRGRSIFEIYFVLYIAMLMVYSFRVTRYLFPVLPLYLFYFCVGLSHLHQSLEPKKARSLVATTLVAVVVIYLARYTSLAYGSFTVAPTNVASREMFRYIRERTNVKDVFVFFKPRALSLFTERSATPYQLAAPDDEMLRHFRSVHASFILVGPHPADSSPRLQSLVQPLKRLVALHPDLFELVYANSDFHLYRLAHPRAAADQDDVLP